MLYVLECNVWLEMSSVFYYILAIHTEALQQGPKVHYNLGGNKIKSHNIFYGPKSECKAAYETKKQAF